jgi:hypothetical protein
MDIFDKFFTKFSYKFDKGYPDMDNPTDVALLESLISEVLGENFSLQEKALNFNDIAGESRKLIRMTLIAHKIREKTPFTWQERGLIDAINSVEGVKTLVGANGYEIPGIIKAEKQPDPPRAEAYADLRLIRKDNDPYLLSAKGIVTPSIAGGGLTGITQINSDLANFVADFYQDAYEYYKEIFDANDEIDYNTNLYRTTYMRDVNRAVPPDLIDDMLRGNEAMGGPVDGYYIGPMEVEYEVKGDKVITNGDVIPLETFADKYDKIFMHIKKRAGDYYFTNALQTVNGVTMPLIFTNKPGGKMAKSRLGTNPKTRGQIII